jgi:hypothetical protein
VSLAPSTHTVQSQCRYDSYSPVNGQIYEYCIAMNSWLDFTLQTAFCVCWVYNVFTYCLLSIRTIGFLMPSRNKPPHARHKLRSLVSRSDENASCSHLSQTNKAIYSLAVCKWRRNKGRLTITALTLSFENRISYHFPPRKTKILSTLIA